MTEPVAIPCKSCGGELYDGTVKAYFGEEGPFDKTKLGRATFCRHCWTNLNESVEAEVVARELAQIRRDL